MSAVTMRLHPDGVGFLATVLVDGEFYASVYGTDRDRVYADATHYMLTVSEDDIDPLEVIGA